MKDMGKVKNYIGIDIDYNSSKNVMYLNQENYIESLEQKYNLKNAKLYNTPMETNLKLNHASEVDETIKYRNLIGELLYISSGTRPVVAYCVNYLSRFQNSYDETIYKYALRVLKYLCSTKNLKLTYIKNNISNVMECMVDADWAGDSSDRKSTSGYVIKLFDNIVYWKSRKQSSVTKAATFAEYVALSEAVIEVNFIRGMLNETFNIKIDEPIKMFEDNSGVIAIAKYGNFTKNSKYIEVHYHYVNEYCEKKVIDIIKVKTNDNVGDILTKSLPKDKFIKFRNMLK